jgi:hypothetical protein
MSITLAVGATTVALPDDLYWFDENWSPVEQTSQRTITGASIVSSALRVAGKPITLQPEADDSAWLSAATLAQLRTWAATPGQQMTLTLRAVAHTVIWRHQDTAVEASPVLHYSDVDAGDFYRATLRFMEIT